MTLERDREPERDRELFADLQPTGAPEGLRRRIVSSTEAAATQRGWLDSIFESRWFRVAVPAAAVWLVLLHAAPERSLRPTVGEEIFVDGVELTRSSLGRAKHAERGPAALGSLEDEDLWEEI